MSKRGEGKIIDYTFSLAEDFLTDTLPRTLEHQPQTCGHYLWEFIRLYHVSSAIMRKLVRLIGKKGNIVELI